MAAEPWVGIGPWVRWPPWSVVGVMPDGREQRATGAVLAGPDGGVLAFEWTWDVSHCPSGVFVFSLRPAAPVVTDGG